MIDLYFPGSLADEAALTKVQIEVYLTDNLKVNILIGTDVLISNKFSFDYTSQSTSIGTCQNVRISAQSIVKPYF